MEPLLIEHPDLEELAMRVVGAAGGLETILPAAVTRQSIIALLRMVNTYYSNRIEGHDTRPADIERAMRQDYVEDAHTRTLQREAKAHIEVEELVYQRLLSEPDLNVCSPDFLRWIHNEFFQRVPAELRFVADVEPGKRTEVIAGALRRHEVIVGRHIPPSHLDLPAFLDRFARFYQPQRLRGTQRVVALAASHQRLMWIHPFSDGNGRVARLFTSAYATRIELAGYGLWSPSRGLARNRQEYLSNLAAADEKRRYDTDGRGALSQQGMIDFCSFFLETCLDQIRYMRSILNLETLAERVMAYAELRASGTAAGPSGKRLPIEAGYLLRDVLFRGEIARGEAARIMGGSERWARQIVSQLLDEKLVYSSSPKGPVRLGFPVHALSYYFPQLFPEGPVN